MTTLKIQDIAWKVENLLPIVFVAILRKQSSYIHSANTFLFVSTVG